MRGPLLPLVLTMAVQGGEPPKKPPFAWADLPATTWTDTRSQQAPDGALVLEDSIRVNIEPDTLERTYRVRIISDAGRRAASIQKWTGSMDALDVRISYPDGSQTFLNKETDFATKPYFGTRQQEIIRTMLIPPGVTSDCLVEIHFKTKLDLQFRGLETWALGNPFKTQTLRLEVGESSTRSVLVMRPNHLKGTSQNTGGRVITEFQDLPPIPEDIPYTTAMPMSIPRLVLYRPSAWNSTNGQDISSFWAAVVQNEWKPFYDFKPLADRVGFNGRYLYKLPPFSKGLRFKQLCETLGKELPESVQARALVLRERLGDKLKNWSYIPFREEDLLKQRKIDYQNFEARDFEHALEVGGTHSLGWTMIYLHLLWAHGVFPNLVKITSIYKRPFLPAFRNEDQFAWTVLCVTEADKPPLWIDPDQIFQPVGHLPVWCQGTTAFYIDTATWKARTKELPWQDPEEQIDNFLYQLRPEKGNIAFTLQGTFHSPASSSLERLKFLSIEPSRQPVALIRTLEKRGTDTRILNASVSDPFDRTVPFSWKAEGAMAATKGPLLWIPPFPALPSVIDLEPNLPDERFDYIYLGAPRIQKAEANIRVPAGFRYRVQQPIHRKSEFGSISWGSALSSDGTEVKVMFEVVITKGLGEPSLYQPFKRFLSDLQAAQERAVIFEPIP